MWSFTPSFFFLTYGIHFVFQALGKTMFLAVLLFQGLLIWPTSSDVLFLLYINHSMIKATETSFQMLFEDSIIWLTPLKGQKTEHH